MSIVAITEIDEMNAVELELKNRYDLEEFFDAIAPIVKAFSKDEFVSLKVGVEVYELMDLLDYPQDVFMQIYHALLKACRDNPKQLGHYSDELKKKLEADPRFKA